MFSLKRFFGKDERFYDLLETSAAEAHHSAHTLVDILQSGPDAAKVAELAEHKRADKKIRDELIEALCRTFITPLEREDIEALSNALYKIPKTVDKFAKHWVVASKVLPADYFLAQSRILDRCTEIVEEMVKGLRRTPKVERMRELNKELQQLEGEADKARIALMVDLYNGNTDPIRVLQMRELAELLERPIDRCRDTGNVVFTITLKYT